MAIDSLRWQIDGALLIAEGSRRSTQREVKKIHEALAPAGIDFILLKGAAYVVAGADASRGRVFGDVDILVRKPLLADTERALMSHGWLPTKMDPYDQRYHREWMHELPPMQNLERQTDIDVHHTLLPPTADPTPDVGLLWEGSVAIDAYPRCRLPCAQDMILHSAAHLFHDGDLDQGLRDLVDLDALFRQYAVEEAFWMQLIERARRHQLAAPLYYALRYTHKILGADIPSEVVKTVHEASGLGSMAIGFMDALGMRVMLPPLQAGSSPDVAISRWLLYVRSHYLRMPLRLLIPHLTRKWLRGDE